MSNLQWHTAFWEHRLPIYTAALEQLPSKPAPQASTIVTATGAAKRKRNAHGSRSSSDQDEPIEPAPSAHQPSVWLRRFTQKVSHWKHQNQQHRKCRMEVQEQTCAAIQSGRYLLSNGSSVCLPDIPLATTVSFSNCSAVPPPVPPLTVQTRIRVRNVDCLEQAVQLRREGVRVALLNMANATKPGGGWEQGAGAQEENLHRRTNLSRFLMDGSCYPIPIAGCLYSEGVAVFREAESKGYPFMQQDQAACVGVISCAARKWPKCLNGRLTVCEEAVLVQKIKTMLAVARHYRIQALVLSAFGCGAFRNPPAHVAELFKRELMGPFAGQFELVVFAIFDDHNAHQSHNPEGNLLPFQREFANTQ